MVAFRPISPSAALQILREIADDNERLVLSDFVEGGVIRAYARVVETLTTAGGQREVRDARIPRPLWKRIVADGRIEHVFATGSVKLAGDGLVGGRPDVIVTGVRFNEINVRDVVAQHGKDTCPPAAEAPAPKPKRKPKPTTPPMGAANDAPPLIRNDAPSAAPQRVRAGLSDDAILVSIADTMDILDVSRGTVANMVKRGDLEARKIGTRTLIVADSIRAFLKRS